MIEVEHLTKKYGDLVAVKDLSFKVDQGKIWGLLGPNAAGKTTTMRILTGYLPANEGKANVAGFDVFSLRTSLGDLSSELALLKLLSMIPKFLSWMSRPSVLTRPRLSRSDSS